jgi:hypothetical protein
MANLWTTAMPVLANSGLIGWRPIAVQTAAPTEGDLANRAVLFLNHDSPKASNLPTLASPWKLGGLRKTACFANARMFSINFRKNRRRFDFFQEACSYNRYTSYSRTR